MKTIAGKLAKKVRASFAPGVIRIHPNTHEAFVPDPWLDNGSQEHLKHTEFRNMCVIFVGVNASHCILTAESVALDH